MELNFFTEDTKMPDINKDKLSVWIQKVIENNNFSAGNINIIFCSDEYLLKTNQEFLGHDYYTDIITFNYCEDKVISGDIFISLCRVNENAEKFNTSDTELLRVIIHGILHLVGFNDESEEEKQNMRSLEDMALTLYNTI